MSLVEAGSLVGGVIRSPFSLEVKKIDGAPPPGTSRSPQQPALMGGVGLQLHLLGLHLHLP